MLEIREAARGDAEGLRELYLEHLTQSLPKQRGSPAEWATLLDVFAEDPDYHLLVGEANGKIVSSVTLVVIRNLTHGMRPYAVVENVVTHADYRGRGYAAALMEEATSLAKAAGCYKMMLMTGSKEDGTLRFYEECGFDRRLKTAFLKKL